MGITIFDHPLSPYGQKVKIALLEKGVPFDAPLPDAIGSGSTPANFLAASPRGEVPAFVEQDVRIFDSTVILEYIEDRWPEPNLLPREPLERARVRMLEDAMDTHFEAITWGLSELRYFGRATGQLAEEMEARAAKQLEGWFNWLIDQLGTRTWFNGDQFGWGDIAVVPFLNGATGFGFNAPATLGTWLARTNERDSVRQCREAAEAVAFDRADSTLDLLKDAVASGAFKREYRDHRLEWMIKTGGLSVVQDGLVQNNIRFIDVFASASD